MKKVDELLDEIELKEEDYDMTGEVRLTEEEQEKLEKSVLNMIRKDQQSEENTGHFRKRKRWLTALAASVAIIGSFAVYASNTDISQIFKTYFGVESSNIGESGKVIGKADSARGITLTVQGVIGDESSIAVIADLTKTDDTVFKGNDLEFGKMEFYLGGEKVDANMKVIDRENQTQKKRIVSLTTYRQDGQKKIEGQQAVLKVDDIRQRQYQAWESEVNLADYINQHPQCLQQQKVAMPEEFAKYGVTKEELADSGYSKEELSKKIDSQPKYGLSDKKLNLSLYDGEQKDWVINNIGFVDGKLHIRMSGKVAAQYMPEFKDERGNIIHPVWSMGYNINAEDGISYEIYDISDIESLKKLKLTAKFYKELGTIQGHWEVPFTLDIKSDKKEIETEKTIPWEIGRPLEIEKLTLSNLEVSTVFHGDKFDTLPACHVVFKDGTMQELFGDATFDSEQEGSKALARYRFEAPVKIEDVAAIKFNNVEIKVQ